MAGMFIGVVAVPLMYDYIPRAKMGTACAGISIVRSFTRWVLGMGAFGFVTLYSKLFCAEGEYDYFSVYIFMIGMSIVGLSIIWYFARQVKKGVLKPVGRAGIEDDAGDTVSSDESAAAETS